MQLEGSVGGNAANQSAKPAGPDVGRVVAVSAPGNNPYYVKHELREIDTIGAADDESHALAFAKTLGTDVAIVPFAGRYYLYTIGGQSAVVAGAPLDLLPAYTGQAGLRLEAGVAAIVNRYGAMYRATELAAPTNNVPASRSANADPFQAYKDLSQTRGGVNALPEAELVKTMHDAMIDTALSMLATSETQARAKTSQFDTPGATSVGEHQQIEDTAKQVLPIQRDIEQRRMFMGMSAPGSTRQWVAQQQAEINQRIVEKKQLLASYPMLGRYESAFEFEQFIAKPRETRAKRLAGDARSVVSDIQGTRKNIQSGDLNLWDVPSVVEATMVGLGIDKDSPQRACVKAEASAQHTKDTVLNIALAVFNIGFGIAGALVSGPVGLAFAAGALGLSSYDAFKSTDEHIVKNAAANTSTDPDDSLLPADAKQSCGWLVVAWGSPRRSSNAARTISSAMPRANSRSRPRLIVPAARPNHTPGLAHPEPTVQVSPVSAPTRMPPA